MVSVHPNNGVMSVKAGTTTVCSAGAQYKATYWSGDNEVSLINTITNFSKFAGFLQDYGNAVGDDVSLITSGRTKAILSGASITAGNLVKFDIATTTAWGCVIPGNINNGGTVTEGATMVVGTCIQGSQGGTDTVCEIDVRPFISTNITTTVVS